MESGDKLIELSERFVERERDASLARIRSQLELPGRLVCDCGDEISEARRAVHPSARDCIKCATINQRMRRRA